MENCIFCKIIRGEIPSARYYEDDDMIVIKDIEPKAKLHYLCIPKEHFALLSEMGYRIIVNQGQNGGQSVPHLHIHLLGGEKLTGF